MAQNLNLKKPDRTVHVGVILMGGETEFLDVAPVDMIHALDKKFIEPFPDAIVPPALKAEAIDFKFHWVSEAGEATPSRITSGLRILPTDSFETCPPLDIVLIGAHNFGYNPTAAELAFVRKSWDDCSAFLTVCGGVDVPRLAGVLDGKTATGPRVMLDAFRQQSPATNWVEKRWVRDGKLWTSGALLNGADLLHNFTKHYWGGGDGSYIDYTAKMGAWPDRDVDYKDVPWKI
ncbi:class I glutamine amidotransferase-like protein [Xylariaceae sp. FL1651]|nr:class I glutamine amidotransferase-like protein [Xylariaceae sp. FL1651]